MRDTSCRRIERSKLPLLSPTNDEGRRGRGLPESSVGGRVSADTRCRQAPDAASAPCPASASKRFARFLLLLRGPLLQQALSGFLFEVFPGVLCFTHVELPRAAARRTIVSPVSRDFCPAIATLVKSSAACGESRRAWRWPPHCAGATGIHRMLVCAHL